MATFLEQLHTEMTKPEFFNEELPPETTRTKLFIEELYSEVTKARPQPQKKEPGKLASISEFLAGDYEEQLLYEHHLMMLRLEDEYEEQVRMIEWKKQELRQLEEEFEQLENRKNIPLMNNTFEDWLMEINPS